MDERSKRDNLQHLGSWVHGFTVLVQGSPFWFIGSWFTVRAAKNREPMNQNGEPLNP
jgi:hypothetical protein